MKVRSDFITNSSSTSFYITNHTNENKCLVEFVKENPQLIEEFKEEYNWYQDDRNFTQEKLIQSARINNIFWKPHEKKQCIFGDEQCTLVGHVFDYMLRNGGESKSFKWRFDRYLR